MIIVILLKILQVIASKMYSVLKEPIVTTIRALLTPYPMKEFGVKVIFIYLETRVLIFIVLISKLEFLKCRGRS